MLLTIGGKTIGLALISPLYAQLQDLQSNVTQIAQMADAAMELGLAIQESSKHLQKHSEWAIDKIIMLENQLKKHNFKLQGFPEGIEENTELRVIISNWLASQIELEKGVTPLLDAAYHLGLPHQASKALPKDILVRCADLHTKKKL